MKKIIYIIFALIILHASAVKTEAWMDGPVIINTGASSYDIGYEPMLAFDNNRSTMWHSQWNDYGEGGIAQYIYPQVLIAELDNIYYIDCVGYLARQDAFNGTAYEYEIWVSTGGSVGDFDTDEGWTLVADGRWDEQFWNIWRGSQAGDWGEFVRVDFDAVEAKLIKFKILDGVGGWASAAALEIGFLGVDYTPMPGFWPKSEPGTPAPVPAPPIKIPEAAPVPDTQAAFVRASDAMIILFIMISMTVALAYKKVRDILYPG